MRQDDELDELARLLRLHGARVVRVAQGVMVALDRQTDTARAYVVVVSWWPGGNRWLAWGPARTMRSPATDIEGAALKLLAHLRQAPHGHQPPAWPDPIRDCTGAGRPWGRLRRLHALLNTRLNTWPDTRLNGRPDTQPDTRLNGRPDAWLGGWLGGRPDIRICGRAVARIITRVDSRGGGRAGGRFDTRVRGRW